MPQSALLKLLVVDDHAAFRQTVRQIFDAMNVEITEASSGEDAVELYSSVKPDWVVMDLRMPGLGGLRATERIRNLDPQARVIVISQFNEPEFREQAQRAGAVEYVNKEDVSRLADIIGASSPRT